MKLFRINSVGSALRALVAWPMLVLGLYMLAAVVGSAIPVNDNWVEEGETHDIYLYDNGIHTSLIFKRDIAALYNQPDNGMPPVEPPRLIDRVFEQTTDVSIAWSSEELERSSFPGDPAIYPYLMIGWGDARFYRETPSWSDVRPATALAAVAGSGTTLIHVDRLRRLPRSGIRKIRLTVAELSTLMWFIEKQVTKPENSPDPIPMPGYGNEDRFYEATDEYRYSALFTCNNWVSEALKTAGVKTGRWTPLPFGVMWWHEDASAKTPH